MSQPHAITKTLALPDGRVISIETGKLAKFADGAVVVRLGDTMLLATVVSAPSQREGVDFLPLSVDYQEKFGSAGKIPGSFQRREGRLSDYEILVCRLVDRILRPMFPKDYHYEVQVMITLISADKEVQPDALAALAASAALSISDIPFAGPISEVRVARIDGQFQINPKTSDLARADMDLMVGATADSVAMVEGAMKEVSEEEMVAAIAFGHEAIKAQCQLQKDLAEAVGRTPESQPREYPKYDENEELKKHIHTGIYQGAYDVARTGNTSKGGRKEGFSQVKKAFLEKLLAEQPELDMKMFGRYYSAAEKKAIRDMMVKERVRLDGRQLTEIRPIWSEINYLPGAHGSAIFTRGETQSLTTATLGTKLDEQIVDQPLTKGYSKFMLHYNFPGFSTGEVKPNRGAGRREIGHGNLALRSLRQVLPPDEENPYTIRIVSDILESNGSSSMATVCAGSLALMDAGVKISAAVAGIAMGLVQDKETGEYAVLSDILGDEDHLGDMDFKVTGTEKGICACQMDIKIQGLSNEILTAALHQAREGRLHILREMAKTIAAPAPAELKPHTPRSHKMLIDKEFIGAVIGPGGKVIQQIQKDTNATVIIEEKDEKGHVSIYASNQEDMQGAIDRIRAIAAQPEVGETYKGKVRSIQPYGAFVEIMPGKDGLLHISEVTHERIQTLEGLLEVGQDIDVKLVEIDKKTGKYRLSRKVLLPKPEAAAASNGEAQA